LAGNLVKPLLYFYGTEWRERGYGLSTVLDNFKRLKTELTPFLTYKKQKIII
jgi:hypothetical protein